ncbi:MULTISPECIES: hypothetical protein [Paenibacillus]|uniref:Uncharacterized protein n=1 Tax=Paenibacillus tundrae TaxID=528187 RepID=A0ABT9WHG1_9BACL|nr:MULTISPECIES: hypothetical protein [Paenibacillus]MDQ0172708.1 hypothetical protein [Paenibacillus tundrae]
MIKYMNLQSFKEYLLTTLDELSSYHNKVIGENSKFIITPVEERGKSLNSTDEYLFRGMLNSKNLDGREFDIDSVVKMLGCRVPLCPLWIKVSLKEIRTEEPVIELETSLRFRKPSLLQNQETGHPPFMAVLKSLN